MLTWFRVPLETTIDAQLSATISVAGPTSFAARDISIPGDISSAAFLIAAAALLPDSNLEIEQVGLNPTRIQCLDTFRSLGLKLETLEETQECNEPRGTLRVSGTCNSPITLVESSASIGGL